MRRTDGDVQHAKRVLHILGVEDQIEGLVYCDYSDPNFCCKPELEFYYQAMRKADVADPKKCCFVDDSRTRTTFATLNIRLRHVTTRIAYTPLSANAATGMLNELGLSGVPDSGVQGGAWLTHLVVSGLGFHYRPDETAMATIRARCDWADAIFEDLKETMHVRCREYAFLQLLFSNTQANRRIARQCPDMMAAWIQ